MKTKIKTLTILIAGLALTLSTLFSSCKKGDTGPAGPTGTNGTNGVANIQTSTVTTNNLSWVFDNTNNSFNATIIYAAITQAVVDKGTIQVFIGDGTSTQWEALPFAYSTFQYNYNYKLGQILISVTLSNGNPPANPGGQQYKVVVIPPAMVKPNVNVKNYYDLKMAYHLQD
jgi:hypothetical protein